MATKDPVILIDSGNAPITLKPLPALLAPPPTSFHSSYGSFSEPTGILVHQDSICISEPSPLPQQAPKYLPSYHTVIQQQSEEIQALRQGLSQLNQKYLDQSNRLHSAEKAQHQAESEIEDLSLSLFEQANHMVATEKKARAEAEQKIQQLEQRLTHVMEELGHEKTQLDELRHKVVQDPKENYEETMMSSSMLCFDTDDALFTDFVNSVQQTPLDQLYRLPFMKQCLELDIEPCLRFGHRKSPLTKKLLETILYQPCFIEPLRRHSYQQEASAAVKTNTTVRRASLNFLSYYGSNKSRQSNPSCCYTCGVSFNPNSSSCLLFRFKLKEQDKEWLWIDRACRDRLVAVCNFYVFIRHVKFGVRTTHDTHKMMKECVWLRLCMFWARTGVYQRQKEDIVFQNAFLSSTQIN